MNFQKRLNLIDQIGRYLQTEYTTSDINTILSQYDVSGLSDRVPNSKWVYVKEVLRHVPGRKIYQIAKDCKFDLTDITIDDLSVSISDVEEVIVPNSGNVYGFTGINNGGTVNVVNNIGNNITSSQISMLGNLTEGIDKYIDEIGLTETQKTKIGQINDVLKGQLNSDNLEVKTVRCRLSELISNIPQNVLGNIVAQGILSTAVKLQESLQFITS